MLCHRTLEQRANLMVGLMILGRRGPWKPTEQGHYSSDVLACPGEVREGFIILDDPPVHVTSHGARSPTTSVALDLLTEFRTFLLELESCFLELLVSGLQLLHPQARWGPYVPLDLVVEVVRWGSLLLVDAFDVSFKGTCHEAFTRGVLASPTGVRARGRPWLLC